MDRVNPFSNEPTLYPRGEAINARNPRTPNQPCRRTPPLGHGQSAPALQAQREVQRELHATLELIHEIRAAERTGNAFFRAILLQRGQ